MNAEVETLHRPFARFLREQKISFITARSDRESTIAEGWPDFTVLNPQRPPLFIEFKTKDGKLSVAQRVAHQNLAAGGFTVHVVRKLDAAIELVAAWRSEVRHEPPPQRHSLYVQHCGTSGDCVVDSAGTILRRAGLADIKAYPRKHP